MNTCQMSTATQCYAVGPKPPCIRWPRPVVLSRHPQHKHPLQRTLPPVWLVWRCIDRLSLRLLAQSRPSAWGAASTAKAVAHTGMQDVGIRPRCEESSQFPQAVGVEIGKPLVEPGRFTWRKFRVWERFWIKIAMPPCPIISFECVKTYRTIQTGN